MINCQQIHQDIANFRAQFEQIQQILKYIDETAKKPANLTDSLDQIQATSDELLTTYLADIYDAYPKLKQYIGGEYSKKLKGLDDDIKIAHQLSDRQSIVFSECGETRILTIDDDGRASYGEEIKGFDGYIHHIHQLPDQRLVVISHSGETRILNLNRPEPSLDHLKQNLDKLVA